MSTSHFANPRPRGRPKGSQNKLVLGEKRQREILTKLKFDAAHNCEKPEEFIANVMHGLPVIHLRRNKDNVEEEVIEYPGIAMRLRAAIALLNHNQVTGATVVNAEYTNIATKLRDSFLERVTTVD